MNASTERLRETIDDMLRSASFERLMETCRTELAVARQRKDQDAEALSLIGFALAHLYLGKFKDARVLIDGAVQQARTSSSPELLVMALTVSGSIHLWGSYQDHDAQQDYREALALAHSWKDERGVAMALLGVAVSYRNMGDLRRAYNYAREAFERARDLDYGEVLVGALNVIGTVFQQNQQRERALQSYQDALEMIENYDLRLQEGLLLGSLGALYARSERNKQQGLEMMQQALEMARELPAAPHEFTALYQLGRTHEQDGQTEQAQDYYTTMLNRAQHWRNRAYEGAAFYSLGVLALSKAQFDNAIAHFEQALRLSRETMNPFREAQAEEALGTCYSLQHDYENALAHFMAARSLYDALDSEAEARQMMRRILMTYLNRLVYGLLRLLGLYREQDTTKED